MRRWKSNALRARMVATSPFARLSPSLRNLASWKNVERIGWSALGGQGFDDALQQGRVGFEHSIIEIPLGPLGNEDRHGPPLNPMQSEIWLRHVTAQRSNFLALQQEIAALQGNELHRRRHYGHDHLLAVH